VRHNQRLKSIFVYIPIEKVEANLSEIGFQCVGSSTIVADGNFCKKMLYVNKEEKISVSEEIGDAYPKDPVITICGSNHTISIIMDGVKN
jgi:hypothetical protein